MAGIVVLWYYGGEVYRPWSRACGGGGSSCWNQDSMMRLDLIEHVLGLEEGELKPEVALQAVTSCLL